MRRDREGEAHVHSVRVALHRCVEELLDAGELDDLIELSRDLGAAHAEDGPVEIHVVSPRELGMEARSDFEEAAQPALDVDVPGRRLGDARENA